MLSALFRTLGFGDDDGAAHETETVSEIAAVLPGVPESRARLLAAFAYLLGRVAFADHDVSADERAVMESRLATEAEVSAEQARHLVLSSRPGDERAALMGRGATDDAWVERRRRRGDLAATQIRHAAQKRIAHAGRDREQRFLRRELLRH